MQERREHSVDCVLARTGVDVSTRRSPGFFPVRHRHEGLELVVVHTGTVDFHYGDRRQVLSSGQAFFLNASKHHSPRVISDRFVRTTFHFMPELAACSPAGRILPQVLEEGTGFRFALVPHAIERLRWVARELRAPQARGVSRFTMEGLIGLVIAELETAAARGRPSRPAVLDAVVDYMAEHVESCETLSDLAGRFSVSPRRLLAWFQEHLGSSPRQYWLRLKMKAARRLLTTTQATVETVATQVGFTSLRGFELAFRRTIGMSPSEYRRKRIQ